MKRYKKYISQTLAALLLGAVAAGCSDDLGFEGNGIVEGEPVTLSVNCAVGDMPEVSRADMAAGRDKEINSMWVAFFAKDGTHEKKYEFTYDNVSQVNTMDVHFPTLSGLNLTSGEYYLVAVANPAGNRGVTETSTTPSDLMGLLTNVNTLEEYKKIAVYTDPGTVGTPTGNLVMQGIYTDPRNHTVGASTDFWTAESEKTVKVPAGTKTLAGAIHFRRLISQVKFNITYDTQNIESFEPVSMTVYNVPTVSWLAEREDGEAGNTVTNAGDNINLGGKEYTSSRRFYSFEGATTRTIDWYQMENRRQAVIDVPSYAKRELERKNDITGSAFKENSGIYTALCGESGDTYMKNNNATYVVLHARLKMKKLPLQENPQDPQVVQRTVDAVYTVHLGYCEGADEAAKAKDFNCRRNYKYTYNMKIIGVDKIEVEAKKEDQDYEHGAEGLITDITGAFFPADSHFEQRNVQLSASELTDLKWSMRIYTDQRNFLTIDQDNYTNFDAKYWDWIGFIPTSSATQCATYNPANVIKLSELKDKGTGGWYTMFIDEYIYEDATTEPGVTHGNLTPNWKSYVNLPDRTMWLKVEEARSQDQESVIVKSKYAVQQKSLQTYYGINPENPASSMALEHINEYEGNAINKGTASNRSTHGGRYLLANTLGMVSGNATPYWNTYVNRSAFQNSNSVEMGVPNMRTTSLAYLCLNRNRDLDGDGVIDRNELRWFLPSISQYERFVMGAQSLATPLYEFDGKDASITAPANHHYGSAEGWTIWSEEYLSIGAGNGNIANVRCARYLNVNMETPFSNLPEMPATPAFEKVDGSNAVIFHYGTESSRDAVTSPLPVHAINSEYNRPSKKIEYKTDTILLKKHGSASYYSIYSFLLSNNQVTQSSWFAGISDRDICAERYNTATEKGWRIPNQVELCAMLMLNLFDETTHANGTQLTYYLSSTREYYGLGRVMGIDPWNNYANAMSTTDLNKTNTNISLRCVRDVN